MEIYGLLLNPSLAFFPLSYCPQGNASSTTRTTPGMRPNIKKMIAQTEQKIKKPANMTNGMAHSDESDDDSQLSAKVCFSHHNHLFSLSFLPVRKTYGNVCKSMTKYGKKFKKLLISDKKISFSEVLLQEKNLVRSSE